MLDTRIFNDSVGIEISISSFGNKKTIQDKGAVATALGVNDPTRISTQKTLIDAPEFKAMSNHLLSIRKAVDEVSIPCGNLLREGTYLIPTSLSMRVVTQIQESLAKFPEVSAKFVEAYPRIKAEAEEKLGMQFPPDFPSAREIADSFKLTWSFFAIQTPQNLPASVATQDAAMKSQRVQDAFSSIRNGLREELLKDLEHLKEKVSEYGKGKRLHETVLTNIASWYAIFADRNLTDDTELADIAATVAGIVGTYTIESLRESDIERAKILSEIDAPLIALVAMMETAEEFAVAA